MSTQTIRLVQVGGASLVVDDPTTKHGRWYRLDADEPQEIIDNCLLRLLTDLGVKVEPTYLDMSLQVYRLTPQPEERERRLTHALRTINEAFKLPTDEAVTWRLQRVVEAALDPACICLGCDASFLTAVEAAEHSRSTKHTIRMVRA